MDANPPVAVSRLRELGTILQNQLNESQIIRAGITSKRELARHDRVVNQARGLFDEVTRSVQAVVQVTELLRGFNISPDDLFGYLGSYENIGRGASNTAMMLLNRRIERTIEELLTVNAGVKNET